jgi:HD-GYP domain-containing protein (c-di-GMP phosphodiesterase class II)/DNA-binding NarL/FixJ family response regulator
MPLSMYSNAPADSSSSKPSAVLHCGEAGRALRLHQTPPIAKLALDFTVLGQPEQIFTALLDKHYDLVLIDVEDMPNTAVELVASIRKHFPASTLPILIGHGPAARSQRNAALAAGATDWFCTTSDDEDIAQRIQHCLRLSHTLQTSTHLQSLLEAEIRKRTSKLDMLIESSLMMAMEKNRSKLLLHILVEGQRLLNCDGGTMYLMTETDALRFAERTRADYLPFDEIALHDPTTGRPNDTYASTYAALYNKTVVIDDVYREHRFDCSGTRDFDARSGYRTISLLTVPMAPRGGKVIGILQFFNAKSPITGQFIPFAADTVELVEALAAQAAVALDNLQLVQTQKDATENIIRIIANALDSKSPHTGHHCVRVPELAFMLAEAACLESEGPLAAFNFASDDEWFEFRVGAWLHDCGKITTPEYVIEKATKLDMLYNRIHEIRLRFEVLLRDAEIACLKACLQGEDPERAQARCAQQQAELLADFAFVADCNVGKETMDDAHVERLERIAQRTWLRHFDDRLGLSREEQLRRQAEETVSLPAEERLLSDKPYHVIPRPFPKQDEVRFGIKMEIPDHLYNFGEIYNLSIRKGTLTPEDRYKINEHIVETIKMLGQMPFPEGLKHVPEYASTHHETLDGSGYPRKLTAAELSIPARIMAIADIFEALTSTDRPYKRPYKLSEALHILYNMKQKQHIDPDLFELFLRSGTYRKFAEQFLAPEQIDEIDIGVFLQPAID